MEEELVGREKIEKTFCMVYCFSNKIHRHLKLSTNLENFSKFTKVRLIHAIILNLEIDCDNAHWSDFLELYIFRSNFSMAWY